MASKKKLLQAAAGSAGGGATTDITDVFSTFLYEGNGSTQVIENGIALGNAGDGGSILLEEQADGLEITQSSDFNFGTGDFTCEAWVWLNDTNTTYRTMLGFDVTLGLLFQVVNMKLDLGLRGTSTTASTSSLTANQWNHLAAVRSSGTVYLFINGTLDRTATTDSSGTSWSTRNLSNSTNALIGDYSKTATNFNGRISNLRVSNTARYTSTFTVPTSALSSDANTVLLIGQNDDPFLDQSSSSHSATPYGSPSKSNFGPFTGTSGEGGLVWTKRRDNTGNGHHFVDTARGGSSFIRSNSTQAANTGYTLINSFNSNGYTLSSNVWVNGSGGRYVSWAFRKAPKFFDVVTYTGTGSAQTISHNLGTTPGFIVVKGYNTAGRSWACYHRSLGYTKRLLLNYTSAEATDTTYWNAEPTDTVFSVGTQQETNLSGTTYVAYLFAHNDGDGEFGPNADQDIIKCGSFTKTDTGLSNYIEVDLGFEVQWILSKVTNEGGNWEIWDVQRGLSYTHGKLLQPNSSSAESNYSTPVFRPTPNGFAYIDNNATSNVYMAIRRGPLAVPTDATDVFAMDTYDTTTGDSTAYDTTFPVDMVIEAMNKNTSSSNKRITSRLTGINYLTTNSTAAEASSSSYTFDTQTGFRLDPGTDINDIAYMWKRAPSYFDVVCYSGDGTTSHSINHNLGVVPEMMWVKRRDTAASWSVYHPEVGNKGRLILNSTSAANSNQTGYWASTDPTATQFTVGIDSDFNNSSGTYIAYLFATVAGVSKVGSYTGNGSTQTIDCGFSSGARFVMLKRTSGIGSWVVFDTERGITTSTDPLLYLDTTGAERADLSTYDINPHSSGFTLMGGGSYTNASGSSYIFYAIA